VDAGIPVVAINVGYADDQQAADYPTGIMGYVGQVETVTGAVAVKHAADLLGDKLDKAMCVKGSIDQGWAVQRCQGFATQLESLGFVNADVAEPGDKTYTILQGEFFADPPRLPGSGDDAGSVTIDDWLSANQDVDFVFSTTVPPLETVLASGHRPSGAIIGSVDLSASTIAAIHGGTCDFTLDQQQYLQGYLPIVMFELQRQFLLVPHSTETGPFIVDAANVDAIDQLVGEGVR